MNTLDIKTLPAQISEARVSGCELAVDLTDGRTIIVPVEWFPRLLNGSESERRNLRLIGEGSGIHWPDLDEDISLEGIIAGHPSAETSESLSKWLKSRSSKAV